MDVLVFSWIAAAVTCAFIGSKIASEKEAENAGFLAGLLLGPFGLLLAAVIDSRPCCPTCGTRLNRRPSLCPSCATRFVWSDGGKLGTYFPPTGKAGPVRAPLMPCPDCGNEVSRLAKACPKCGRPIAV